MNNVMFGQMRMLYGIFPNKMKRYVIRQILLPSICNKDKNWNSESKAIPENVLTQIDKAQLQAENNVIELFQTMLKIINSFRNTLAHGGSILTFKSDRFLQLKYIRYFCNKGFTDNEFKKKNFGNGIFGVLLILLMSLDRFDAAFLVQKLEYWEKKNTQNIDQKKAFNTFIKKCGLPEDFIDRLKEIQQELYNTSKLNFPDLFKF